MHSRHPSALLRTLLCAAVLGVSAEPLVTEAVAVVALVRVRRSRHDDHDAEAASGLCRSLSSSVPPSACALALDAVGSAVEAVAEAGRGVAASL